MAAESLNYSIEHSGKHRHLGQSLPTYKQPYQPQKNYKSDPKESLVDASLSQKEVLK